MTTALSVLETRLAALIGDSNGSYESLYEDAINNAVRETYPHLYKALDVHTLIGGNILPNSHFEDWASASYPDFCSLSNATATATTTAGLYRGGAKSARVTASAADGYMCWDSNSYPRLLDLMGHTVSFKAWAYPEVANDAFLTIYTIQADGTEQTLNSTTTCPAGKFTLLELETQALNDDLTRVQFRFRVHTNAKYAYFDNSRVTGIDIYEYLLPTDFRRGDLDEVFIQVSGSADDPCDELHPQQWRREYEFSKSDDGTYKYLKMPVSYGKYQIRIKGRKPLDTMAEETDTINIEDEGKINLLLHYAAHRLYEAETYYVSSQDVALFKEASAKHLGKYYELLGAHAMPRPRKFINRSL